MWRYVGVTVDGVELAGLREVAFEICSVDNDVGQMTSCPSDGFMKRKLMLTTETRTV